MFKLIKRKEEILRVQDAIKTLKDYCGKSQCVECRYYNDKKYAGCMFSRILYPVNWEEK